MHKNGPELFDEFGVFVSGSQDKIQESDLEARFRRPIFVSHIFSDVSIFIRLYKFSGQAVRCRSLILFDQCDTRTELMRQTLFDSAYEA